MEVTWEEALEAHREGEYARAFAICEKCLDRNPENFGATHLMGVLAMHLGQPAEALVFFNQALSLVPSDAAALVNRGSALQKLGRSGEALEAYLLAAELHPEFGLAWYNLGNLQKELGAYQEAADSLEKCVCLMPEHADAHLHLGLAKYESGLYAQALPYLDRTLELAPDHADAYKNRAFARLMLGDYTAGLVDYEWRWQTQPLQQAWKDRACPQWDGSQGLHGKSILVHAEQGLGDTLQFSRLLPLIKARGAAHVVFEVQRSVLQLMRHIKGADVVVPAGLQLPTYDFHVPLLSLLKALEISPSSIPAVVPYLWSNPSQQAYWHPRLSKDHFNIGICWRGSAKGAEVGKSIPLTCFSSLADVPCVRLYSLQKLDDVTQPEVAEAPFELHTFGPEFDAKVPFEDSAAVISRLDLVITTDTSVAHLAGALGAPVWMALPQVCDWRWGPSGSTTAWYPNMKLFRQSVRGQWVPVFRSMRQELAALCAARSWRLPPTAQLTSR